MKRAVMFALCITACLTCAHAASATEPGDVLWEGMQPAPAEGSSSQGKGVAVDPEGNILMTGFVEGADGNYDILTCKYSPVGDLIWSRTYNYSWYDVGEAVASDSQGDVIVVGASQNYQRPIDIYLKTYYTDYVLVKYSPDGVQLFDADASGNGKNNMPSAVTVGPDGSIYITGQTRDAADTHNAFYTVKFDANGVRQWERVEDWGSDAYAAGIGLVPDGIVVSGHVWDAAQADYDIKFVKYYRDTGDPITLYTYKPPGPNYDETAQGMATLPDGTIYITGRTSDGGGQALTLCFDPDFKPLWSGALYIARRMTAGRAVGIDEHKRTIVAAEMKDSDGNRTPLLVLYGADGALEDQRPYLPGKDFQAEDMVIEPDGDIVLTGVLFEQDKPDVMVTVRLAGYPSDLPNPYDLEGSLSAGTRLSLKSPPMPMLRKVRLTAVPVFLYGCLPVTAVVAEPVGMPGEYEYRFFVEKGASLDWEMARDYSPTKFFMLAPSTDKQRITGVMVQVRAVGSDMDYQAVEYMYMDKLSSTQ